MKNWQIIGFLAILIIGIVLISGCITKARSSAATTPPQIVYITGTTTLTLTTPTLTTPNNQIEAKMLPIGYYGQINEYLEQGKTNTYYFDVDNSNNIKMIKIWSDAQPSNQINLAVGFGYVPTFDKLGYDYISNTISSQIFIEITNPKQGRYFAILKGEKGSGNIRIQWETFNS